MAIKSNHDWHTDNGTKVEIISNEKVDNGFCEPTNINISGEAAKRLWYVKGVYKPTAEWSAGRQIFKHSNRPLYLFMKRERTHWGVRASVDNRDGKSYNVAKIVSGSAPDMCPYSPGTAIKEQENRTHWAYGVGGKWQGSADISVVAVYFAKLDSNLTSSDVQP